MSPRIFNIQFATHTYKQKYTMKYFPLPRKISINVFGVIFFVTRKPGKPPQEFCGARCSVVTAEVGSAIPLRRIACATDITQTFLSLGHGSKPENFYSCAGCKNWEKMKSENN
ncbi:hypothetical protein CEXT_694391 [Caerostris extrusa]|uniref:Uncharacterized protein n=1 Tax=Caerostris extrusa TaxID=172846 RepID=A0AAV4Y2G3_CAEEX|nr:hypothetical protein CEXT_694391 [Caerostris extrusa]